MKILDLTQPLTNNMPVFPQDPNFLIKELLNSAKDEFTLSILKTGLHAGTHIDAPYHFNSSGKKVIEIELDELVESSKEGSVKIIDFKALPKTPNQLSSQLSNSSISTDSRNDLKLKEDLDKEIKVNSFYSVEKGDLVIIKTKWSKNWGLDNYFTKNPYLSNESVEFLIEKEIRGLAIDGPSVDKFGETNIHKKMLFNDIWIIENLKNLEMIPEADYTSSLEFFFIPLPLTTEASPIRAFVRIED